MKRLLEYLNNTKNVKIIIIGMDGLSIMKTYVDTSYAVHPHMRGHSGGLITVGKGPRVPQRQNLYRLVIIYLGQYGSQNYYLSKDML